MASTAKVGTYVSLALFGISYAALPALVAPAAVLTSVFALTHLFKKEDDE